MINFWKMFSNNKKDKLTLKEEIEMKIYGNSEKNEELKKEYDKRLELEKKKIACNLYLSAYTSKKPLNKTEFNIYQNYNNPISYYEQMRGYNNYYQSSIGNGLFGNIFG